MLNSGDENDKVIRSPNMRNGFVLQCISQKAKVAYSLDILPRDTFAHLLIKSSSETIIIAIFLSRLPQSCNVHLLLRSISHVSLNVRMSACKLAFTNFIHYLNEERKVKFVHIYLKLYQQSQHEFLADITALPILSSLSLPLTGPK